MNRDTARESVIQIVEVSPESRAMMVMIYGCEGSMSNCDDHHLALMVTRGTPINNCNSSYQKHLKAKYHFENSSAGSKYALQHINNQCEKIGFGLRQEKSPKNFIY